MRTTTTTATSAGAPPVSGGHEHVALTGLLVALTFSVAVWAAVIALVVVLVH